MPLHDPKTGRLTHAGAIAILKSGGSVTFNGRLYNSLETLPSEAEFAQGDPAAVERARKSLAERRAQLEKEQAALDTDASGTTTSPPETGAGPAASAPTADGLEAMSMKELKAMADEEGVAYNNSTPKLALIGAIRTKRAESAEPPPSDNEQ